MDDAVSRRAVAPTGARHICVICSVRLPTIPELVAHMRSEHLNPQPYVCMECEERFAHYRDLALHLAEHTGESFTEPGTEPGTDGVNDGKQEGGASTPTPALRDSHSPPPLGQSRRTGRARSRSRGGRGKTPGSERASCGPGEERAPGLVRGRRRTRSQTRDSHGLAGSPQQSLDPPPSIEGSPSELDLTPSQGGRAASAPKSPNKGQAGLRGNARQRGRGRGSFARGRSPPAAAQEGGPPLGSPSPQRQDPAPQPGPAEDLSQVDPDGPPRPAQRGKPRGRGGRVARRSQSSASRPPPPAVDPSPSPQPRQHPVRDPSPPSHAPAPQPSSPEDLDEATANGSARGARRGRARGLRRGSFAAVGVTEEVP